MAVADGNGHLRGFADHVDVFRRCDGHAVDEQGRQLPGSFHHGASGWIFAA